MRGRRGKISEPARGITMTARSIRLIAADYLNLARQAEDRIDPLRRKRHAQLVSLADREVYLRKMPQTHRYSNCAAFAAAFEKWYEVVTSVK